MNETKRGAVQYIGILIGQRLLGAFCFFLAAGHWNDLRGILYFTVYTAVAVIAAVILFRGHAETLSARRKAGADTKRWDKILLAVYVPLAFYGVYAAAGLSVRLGQPPTALPLFAAGLILMAAVSLLGIWPIMENRNFESSVRIQKDRGQSVCSTGPYAIVRHPGYTAIILWAMSIPMIFGLYAGITAGITAILIIIRTGLEDRMLKRELPGYLEYSRRVRYRLIPYIW